MSIKRRRQSADKTANPEASARPARRNMMKELPKATAIIVESDALTRWPFATTWKRQEHRRVVEREELSGPAHP